MDKKDAGIDSGGQDVLPEHRPVSRPYRVHPVNRRRGCQVWCLQNYASRGVAAADPPPGSPHRDKATEGSFHPSTFCQLLHLRRWDAPSARVILSPTHRAGQGYDDPSLRAPQVLVRTECLAHSSEEEVIGVAFQTSHQKNYRRCLPPPAPPCPPPLCRIQTWQGHQRFPPSSLRLAFFCTP